MLRPYLGPATSASIGSGLFPKMLVNSQLSHCGRQKGSQLRFGN